MCQLRAALAVNDERDRGAIFGRRDAAFVGQSTHECDAQTTFVFESFGVGDWWVFLELGRIKTTALVAHPNGDLLVRNRDADTNRGLGANTIVRFDRVCGRFAQREPQILQPFFFEDSAQPRARWKARNGPWLDVQRSAGFRSRSLRSCRSSFRVPRPINSRPCNRGQGILERLVEIEDFVQPRDLEQFV